MGSGASAPRAAAEGGNRASKHRRVGDFRLLNFAVGQRKYQEKVSR